MGLSALPVIVGKNQVKFGAGLSFLPHTDTHLVGQKLE